MHPTNPPLPRPIASPASSTSSGVTPRPISAPRKILPLGNPPPQPTLPSPSSSIPGGRQVLRVNSPDSPPCARCRASGQPCVFEKVQKPEESNSNSQRIAELETKWNLIENTLGDVLKELRDVKSTLNGRPSSSGRTNPFSGDSPASSSPQDFRSTTYSPRVGTSPPHPPSRSFSSSQSQLHPVDQTYNGQMPPPSYHSSTARRRQPPSSSQLYSANNSGDEEDLPNAALAAPISVVNASAQPVSSDDDDRWTTESAGDGHLGSIGSPPIKRKRRDSSVTDRSRARFKDSDDHAMDLDHLQRPTSRPRLRGPDETSMSSVATSSSLAFRGRRRRTRDVVEKGYITEDDAQQLYKKCVWRAQISWLLAYRRSQAIFLGAIGFSVDTYASIKERSPFLLCALLMVGAKVRDGPVVSDLQALLLQEATEHAKDRVFESKCRVEDVQALLLLAGWSHSMGGVGWLTAGHAIRVAVELGVHKALSRLEKMQASHNSDPERHRPLITAARTWLALYVFEYQISFGTGRPAMMKGDTAITKAKDILLNHPLSIATDARLVSTCELLTRQNAIHQRLESCLEDGDDSAVYRTLQEATADIDGWLEEWDIRMSASQPTAGFFRSSAAIQRAYAHLFHNCIALRQLKTVADAKSLSPEMRNIALQAIGSAKECVSICLNNQEYRDGMKYAVAYTHTCAAFAGAFLLRFARLFPDDVNMEETAHHVDSLANILCEVPAVSVGNWLRKMANHTRQRALESQTDAMSDISQEASASPSIAGERRDPSGVHTPTNGLGILTTPSNHVSFVGPPPPPPLQLPNSQPFVPLSASDRGRFPEPYNALGGSALQSGSGVGDFVPQHHQVAHDSASGILHGLLGDGSDWPPWLTTSMVGDLDQSFHHPSMANDLTFAWDPLM
ncbi:hypothetical protein FRB90_004537 [Tulasnella sp. 427]|nr:hypothetical protein FRB90_004537 [Tulasnella sp. 427]